MAKGKYAIAISERSGFKFPWREMIKEPGTGVIVHPSESDGKYNLVDHPQNHIGRIRAEKIGLSWSSPEVEATLTRDNIVSVVANYSSVGGVDLTYLVSATDYYTLTTVV